jgi:hypothetical protein
MESYLKNPNIGPSVADFRRFLMKCEPRPNFQHFVLACGTVIRGDLLNNITPGQIHDCYNETYKKMMDIPTANKDICDKLFTLLTHNISDNNLLETSAVWSGENIWLVHMINEKYGNYIINLAPGKNIEDACPYAIEAYRADHVMPILAAVINPRKNTDDSISYDIIWPYGRPDTYHW